MTTIQESAPTRSRRWRPVRDDTSVRLALTQLAKEDPNQFIREQSSRVLRSRDGRGQG